MNAEISGTRASEVSIQFRLCTAQAALEKIERDLRPRIGNKGNLEVSIPAQVDV